jgi:thiol-disulfide isomerase/thioredoxin
MSVCISARNLLCIFLLLAVMGLPARAQDKPAVPIQAEPTPAQITKLEIGQAAPALEIEHWVKGDPVKKFEKDKVYVVEFWATWCGPCRQSIPHLTKLQKEFKDKGVTVIGVSGQDRRGVEDVRPFVQKQGDTMNYTVAVDKEMATTRAYMAATGRSGIPCAYVVDKQGKLAWYGHPMEGMDLVIAGVLENKFDAAKHAERMLKFRQASEAFGQAYQSKDWAKAEKSLDEMKELRPDMSLDWAMSRFWMNKVGKREMATADSLRNNLETTYKDDLDALRRISEMLVSVPEQSASDKAAALALAEKVVDKTSGKDAIALAILAKAYKNNGEWDKALTTQNKAIEATNDDGLKVGLQGVLNQMETDRQTQETTPPAAEKPKGDK